MGLIVKAIAKSLEVVGGSLNFARAVVCTVLNELSLEANHKKITGKFDPWTDGKVRTIKCPNCGREVPDTYLTCPSCPWDFVVVEDGELREQKKRDFSKITRKRDITIKNSKVNMIEKAYRLYRNGEGGYVSGRVVRTMDQLKTEQVTERYEAEVIGGGDVWVPTAGTVCTYLGTVPPSYYETYHQGF